MNGLTPATLVRRARDPFLPVAVGITEEGAEKFLEVQYLAVAMDAARADAAATHTSVSMGSSFERSF